ncbi:MAG: alpha/beta fold hydrolase, partial [Actinomycetota bacterium]|nr:alpha/beta fold hydrolase [Actinomycetota bacterium]
MTAGTARRVRSGEVDLAVREYGDPAAPPLLAVHGYPDTQVLWEPVAARLADRFRVVTYDVRGAGESTAPRDRDGYHVDRLVDDVVAVLDAVARRSTVQRPVHLLGHDWGSVQLWEVVTREQRDDRLRGRLASYT